MKGEVKAAQLNHGLLVRALLQYKHECQLSLAELSRIRGGSHCSGLIRGYQRELDRIQEDLRLLGDEYALAVTERGADDDVITRALEERFAERYRAGLEMWNECFRRQQSAFGRRNQNKARLDRDTDLWSKDLYVVDFLLGEAQKMRKKIEDIRLFLGVDSDDTASIASQMEKELKQLLGAESNNVTQFISQLKE